MDKLAPIVLFVYNRPEHTQKVVATLKLNKLADKSELFIFSDASKNIDSEEKVAQIRRFLKTISGFKKITIIERKQNMGLANSIISGVSEIMKKHGKAIILEDDLLTSVDFIEYMNNALEFYENDDRIFSISAYCLPIEFPKSYNKDVYMFNRISSWGWASWANRWNKADWEVSDFDTFIKDSSARNKFDRAGEGSSIALLKQIKGKTDSWAIRFDYACYKSDSYCLYPVRSKIVNIGADGSGRHDVKTNKYKTELNNNPIKLEKDVEPNAELIQILQHFLKKSIIRKIINKFLLIVNS